MGKIKQQEEIGQARASVWVKPPAWKELANEGLSLVRIGRVPASHRDAHADEMRTLICMYTSKQHTYK